MRDSGRDKQWNRLLEQARQGSRQALGSLLEPYREYLLSAANREVGDDLKAKEGASDIVQETFCDAVRGFERFRGSSQDDLNHWLKAILECRLMDFVRRYRRSAKRQIEREVSIGNDSCAHLAAEQIVAPGRTPPSQAVVEEEAIRLLRALASLKPRDAQVLRWRDHDALSYPEIGRRLGMSEDGARKIWVNAVKRLRIQLAARGDANLSSIISKNPATTFSSDSLSVRSSGE